MHRVVITGVGCISALGPTARDLWEGLVAGRSAIRPLSPGPSRDEVEGHVAAEVTGFEPTQHFEERPLALLDRFSQLAVVAAREALGDAGIDRTEPLGDEAAVVLGTGIGGNTTQHLAFRRYYGEGLTRVHPLTIPRIMPSAASSALSMHFGARGPGFTVTSACSSSGHAIGQAYWLLKHGQADLALTGGSEACLTTSTFRAWLAMRVLASDTCRPFCRDRQGMVLGEGAAVLVLETLERARARGAPVYAEIVGFGLSSDAHDLVHPSVDGASRALGLALREGELAPDDIDYINAHGTGTAVNDVTETRAVHRVFGEHARRLWISSTKSMHGHALGATGAIELVATAQALRAGVVPPTANFTEADPECDLDYVPNGARERSIRAALSVSLAFGGLNAVLALRRLS
jgi:nodulation protein E